MLKHKKEGAQEKWYFSLLEDARPLETFALSITQRREKRNRNFWEKGLTGNAIHYIISVTRYRKRGENYRGKEKPRRLHETPPGR